MGGKRKIRLLVVEDNLSEFLPLQQALKRKFPADTVVSQADTMVEGLTFAMEAPCQAVLLSYKLQGGSPREMIETIKERYRSNGWPESAYFLIFDPAPSGINYTELLRLFPNITLIERPYLVDEVARLVQELVMPPYGGEATHYSLGLYDLIQAYVLSRQSMTLRVMDAHGGMGTIAIRNGHLLHASHGTSLGLQALAEIALMRNARIRLERGCHTAMETITLHPQEALCEAARIIEEQRRKLLTRQSGVTQKVAVRTHTSGKGVFATSPSRTVRKPTDSAIAQRDTVAEEAVDPDDGGGIPLPPPRADETLVVEPADTAVGDRHPYSPEQQD